MDEENKVYVKEWVDRSVTQHVAKGAEIRREKHHSTGSTPRPHLKKLPSTPCPGSTRSKQDYLNSNSCSASPQRHFDSSFDSNSKPESSVLRRRKPRRCPLRIAELAEPTKRQCLNTWQNKGNTLPSFMLDRLRRQVMGQTPVIKVTDAINCFETYNNHKRKQNKRGDKKLCQMRQRKEDMGKFRDLSIFFAHGIAKRLIRPIKIELSPEMAVLSKVVGDEFYKLFMDRYKSRIPTDFETNEKVVQEMSCKVAFWISGIMNDAYLKLVENDLRAKKTLENKKGQAGTLITNVERELNQKNLEDEEGPALDALEDLMGSVLRKVGTSETENSTASPPSPHYESSSQYNHEEDEDSLFPDDENKSDQSLRWSGSIDESFPTQMDNTPHELHDTTGVYDIEQEKKADEEEMGSNGAHDDDTLVEYSDQASLIEQEIKIMLNKLIDDDRLNVNVSDAFGVFSGDNDGQRVVTFTESSNGGDELIIGEPKSVKSSSKLVKDLNFASPNLSILSFADEPWPDSVATHAIKKNEVSKSITSLGKIIEGRVLVSRDKGSDERDTNEPYDEHVIELMNEREDTSKSTLSTLSGHNFIDAKKTISTSSDGYQSHPELNQREPEDDDTDTQMYVFDESMEKDEDGNFENYVETEQDAYEKENEKYLRNKEQENVNEVLNHERKISEDIKRIVKMIENDKPDQSDKKHEFDEHTQKVHQFEAPATSSVANVQAAKGDHIDTDSTNDMMLKAIQQKMKLSYDQKMQKIDFRVNPQTAPAWAIINPSDESSLCLCPKRYTGKYSGQLQVRQWCKDLEHTALNLAQWHHWVEDSCRKILELKQRSEMNEIFAVSDRKKDLRDWLKLKREMDKDAILWKKLNQQTLNVLNSYKATNKLLNGGGRTTSRIPESCGDSAVDLMSNIDSLSSWLHRVIVSTEYSARCSCVCYPQKRRLSPQKHTSRLNSKKTTKR